MKTKKFHKNMKKSGTELKEIKKINSGKKIEYEKDF